MGARSTKPAVETPRRGYRSQLRDQRTAETRQAVLNAARQLFVVNGWAATGMRDIATEAGVALETVYSHFSSKRGLLRVIIDTAAVGDEEPRALAARPEFAAMGRGRRPARLRAAAAVVAAVNSRTASMAKLLRESASGDPEIAEMLYATRERQRHDVASALALIMGRQPTPAERDGVWAVVSPEVYLLLVEQSGWTPEQYEAWIASSLDGLIPRS